MTSIIYHFTSELFGGAGVAAQRLHTALRQQNVHSRLYFDEGSPQSTECVREYENQTFFRRNAVALARSWRHRRNARTGFVTSPRWIRKTSIHSLDAIPDIVNLHWVSRWLDLPSFLASLPQRMPVVWSLHDMNPFTGGCHHAGDCDRFTNHCGNCPQLKWPGARDDVYRFFDIKSRSYENLNLHFVGNSEWTTTQARRSALARHVKSFRTIPLGINIDEFRPIDKGIARQALGLDENGFVVGFACADFNDQNKGGELLIQALQQLSTVRKITLLVFGSGMFPETGNRLDIVTLGVLNSSRVQSLYYSALDVFTAPSRIESFGLTALESMACGTPVVAFHTGGLPEVVIDEQTGLLEKEIGNGIKLAQKIQRLFDNPSDKLKMGLLARERVVKYYRDDLIATRYISLYEALTGPFS